MAVSDRASHGAVCYVMHRDMETIKSNLHTMVKWDLASQTVIAKETQVEHGAPSQRQTSCAIPSIRVRVVQGLLELVGQSDVLCKAHNTSLILSIEPWHEISNNVVCATSKASDQPAHTRSLIRAFACCLNII